MAFQQVRSRAGVFGTVAIAAAALCGPLAVAPAAQAAPAAPASRTTTFTVPAGVSTVSKTIGSAHVSVTRATGVGPLPMVTCTLSSEAPVHFMSIVYGRAKMQCSATMQRIELTTSLYRNGTRVATKGPEWGSSTKSVENQAYVTYEAGNYYTGGESNVTFPVGHMPPTGSVGNYSEKVDL
ncbi:hypothetical protein [Streptomyces luteireticuli]|uniref:Uncharacterized protein n=1 Tax=Streptomyces luteireticuli TaxID=173858 RepID=A0ABP3IZQ7_9ACTN